LDTEGFGSMETTE